MLQEVLLGCFGSWEGVRACSPNFTYVGRFGRCSGEVWESLAKVQGRFKRGSVEVRERFGRGSTLDG